MNQKFKVENGLLRGSEFIASPNANERPSAVIDLVVLHNISLPPNQFGTGAVRDFFCNRLNSSKNAPWYYRQIASLKVSSHLFIDRQGEVLQFVELHRRAWHAGVSGFLGRDNCNDYSIGIELEGSDNQPFTDYQYQTLNAVLRAIMLAYPLITPARVVGHSHIAAGRKSDPGRFFEWHKLNFET